VRLGTAVQELRGALTDQIPGGRIGARRSDPVRILALLSTPLDVGSCKEIWPIRIHRRHPPNEAKAADSSSVTF